MPFYGFISDASCQISLIICPPFSLKVVWLGDEGLEIKRQITGMMRLLSDKTSRVYQRVGAEQDSLTVNPHDGHQTWVHQLAPLSLGSEDSDSWTFAGDPGPSPSSISTPILNGQGCGQYSTRSKTLRILSNTSDLIKVKDVKGRIPQYVGRGDHQIQVF